MNGSGSVLVSWHFSDNSDGILLVGEKQPNESVKIINAFSGENAKELYKTLTGRSDI